MEINTTLLMAQSKRIAQLEEELAKTRGVLKETSQQLDRLYSYCAFQSSPDTRYEGGMMSGARKTLDKLRMEYSELINGL
jgi:uncharacterized coiled-coil protein SlyX